VSFLFAALVGCNTSGIYPVEGQLVWKNGQPAKELENSLIFFEQPEKQISARGQIKSDGSFRLTTNKENDGAPVGEHTVRVLEVGRRAIGDGGTQLAPGKIDTRYASHATSDLKATTKPGLNKITLTVEPPK
jgi:hypothetical protein